MCLVGGVGMKESRGPSRAGQFGERPDEGGWSFLCPGASRSPGHTDPSSKGTWWGGVGGGGGEPSPGSPFSQLSVPVLGHKMSPKEQQSRDLGGNRLAQSQPRKWQIPALLTGPPPLGSLKGRARELDVLQ